MSSSSDASNSRGSGPAAEAGSDYANTLADRLIRIGASFIAAVALLFLLNNYLVEWQGWPGVAGLFGHYQWLGAEAPSDPLSGGGLLLGWGQTLLFPTALLALALWVAATPRRTLRRDATLLGRLAAYIVRAAFYSVLLIGLVDMTISFLRVEALLPALLGDELVDQLARPQYRGLYVHTPLLLLSFAIALFSRALGFTWLALLVVMGEFLIVILRFVFSYEQAFMGDLVRFWYAALFLFASAHTLLLDGHVRVDVLYTQFSATQKAWANITGVLLLGLPLCWVILALGMWDKTSSINSPLLNFEVSQSGYGMYVKYLMVAFLVVFAVSMVVQFASFLLSNAAVLRGEGDPEAASASDGQVPAASAH